MIYGMMLIPSAQGYTPVICSSASAHRCMSELPLEVTTGALLLFVCEYCQVSTIVRLLLL